MSQNNIIVGITHSPPKEPGGFMSNGLEQNVLFLYKALTKIDGVHPMLVAMPSRIPEENHDATNPFYLDSYTGVDDKIPVFNIEEFKTKYQLHVLLMVSYSPTIEFIKALKNTGTKIIGIAYGHKFVMNLETMAFGHLEDPIRKRTVGTSLHATEPGIIDGVMYSPHFEESRQHIAYTHGVPLRMAQPCPYIWGPEIVESVIKDGLKIYPKELKNPYFSVGDKKNRTIYTVEPNINVVKTNLLSIGVAELLERRRPTLFDKMHLFGASPTLVVNKAFVARVKSGPLAKPKGTTHTPKLVFENRNLMSRVYSVGRVQFAHQWHCPLNYTLLESAYYRHPVVHNSHFMADMGYYYHMNNIFDAAEMTSRALRHEERDDLDYYDSICADTVEKYHWSNPQNLEGYRSLISYFNNGGLGEITLPPYIEDNMHQLKYANGNLLPYSFL